MERAELNCREFIDFLANYLDGGLDAAERARFEAHLRACAACVAYLDGYRQSAELPARFCDADGPPPGDVPPELIAAILATRRLR